MATRGVAATAQRAPMMVRAAWLTTVLRHAGALPDGRVRQCRVLVCQRTAGGSLTHCVVEYTREAPTDLPRRVLVKRPRPDRPRELLDAMGRKEVAFYRDVAPTLPAVPVPRCLAADVGDAGQWHLVLEDLSATHAQPPWPVPPVDGDCGAVIDTLATLHGSLWASPRLDREFGPPPMAEEIAHTSQLARERVDRFVAFLGDRLSPARRACFRSAVEGLPRLWEWWCRRETRTLVHGDAHAWNFLFPRAPAPAVPASSVYLIDWQNWQAGPPTFDLATFMVLDWYPERRARLEVPLLRRYYDRLLALGVRGYDWAACWRDYRLAAANALFTCAWRWDNGTEAHYWWPHLEAALAAFVDLDCMEVLAS